MSEVKKQEMDQIQDPHMEVSATKCLLPTINLKNLLKTSLRIQEMVGMVVAAIIFLSVYFLMTSECFEIGLNLNKTLPIIINKPTLVWYTTDIWWIPLNREITCKDGPKTIKCDVFRKQTQPENPDVYIFYAANIDTFPLPRNSQKIWAMLHDETPTERLMFMHEEALNLFNYSATFSRHSDMPIPLIWLTSLEDITSPLYYTNTATKNALLSKFAPIMYLQSDCYTTTERDAYVNELMKYIAVDSYGACLHNRKLPLHKIYTNPAWDGAADSYMNHLFGQELLKFMAKYKFIIAIENAICNDYMTEKLWRAIQVGSVPIYFGSPLIRDWLPNNKSAILLEDFPTPELLSQHLHYLLQNDTAYEEYLEHKNFGTISNQKLIDEITSRPFQTDLTTAAKAFECFICEKVHNRSRNVRIVTKKHYDCQLPTSALTLSVNPNNPWLQFMKQAKAMVDQTYQEIGDPNTTFRQSIMRWWYFWG